MGIDEGAGFGASFGCLLGFHFCPHAVYVLLLQFKHFPALSPCIGSGLCSCWWHSALCWGLSKGPQSPWFRPVRKSTDNILSLQTCCPDAWNLTASFFEAGAVSSIKEFGFRCCSAVLGWFSFSGAQQLADNQTTWCNQSWPSWALP